MIKFEMTGLDELNKRLRDLSEKAAALDGTQAVPLTELLTPSFVSKYTRFGNIDDMFGASGFKIETQEDFAAIPDAEWDEFIRSISPFSGWQMMLQEAGKSWTAKKLGF